MGVFLRKYGAATTVDFQLFEVDGVDFRVDAAHAAGDTKIMKDEGAEANTASGFVDEGRGYSIAVSGAELTCARATIYVVDQTATKVWLDTAIVIETYGHASAMHALDLDSATVTLADGGLTAAKIAGDAITAAKIAASAITSSELADGAITAAKIAANAIGSSEIADGAIDAGAIAADAITSAKIATGAITATAIAADAITSSELATSAVDEIVDAVWNETNTGHVDAGKAGQQLWTDVDAILVDTGTSGVAISQTVQQAIADEILKRGISNVEDAADATSLAALILAAFESAIVGTTWTIRKTGGTTFATRTATLDAAASPITGVT